VVSEVDPYGSNLEFLNREMSTKNRKKFLENKGRPARKADNLTAICEPTV
jgi:hypothetical protein